MVVPQQMTTKGLRGYNRKGEKIMNFKNIRIASKITGMSQKTIWSQVYSSKHRGNIRSSITFKKATI